MEIILDIKLYGTFRQFQPVNGEPVRLIFSEPPTVEMLKNRIASMITEQKPYFQSKPLIYESAIASEHKVMSDDTLINQSGSFSLLPPVCGG